MAAGSVLLFSRPITWANFKRDPFGTFMCALIHLTTRSRFNHAALDIGDGLMVEATSRGVVVSPIQRFADDPLTKAEDEITAVAATNEGNIIGCLSDPGACASLLYIGDDLEQVLAWGTGRVGNKYGYVTAFFCGLRNLFPGWSIVQDKAFICSQLVSEALERAGHDFSKGSERVSPGDLAEHFGVPRR